MAGRQRVMAGRQRVKGNLKLDAILVNFAFVGDLITKEDLEETYRTLYFSKVFYMYVKGKIMKNHQIKSGAIFYSKVFLDRKS